MRYCRRIRRLKRMSQITTEIHAEISQVLHHNHIIFCCQFTDNSQFFLFQTNPCRIIRIGVYDSSNFARAQHAFQFIMQSSPPISINIKFFPLHPYNAKLGFLNRKSGSINNTLFFPEMRCVQAINEPNEPATEPVVGTQHAEKFLHS